MPMPRRVAVFNKRVTNRFMEPVARRFANFAIVIHTGRRSGTPYSTPVNCFAFGPGRRVIALTYGPNADWVQNLTRGLGQLEFDGRRHQIESVRLIGRREAWPYLPPLVRGALKLLRVRDFALVTYTVQ